MSSAGSDTARSTPLRSVIVPRWAGTASSVSCWVRAALRSAPPCRTPRYTVRPAARTRSRKNSAKIAPIRCWTTSTRLPRRARAGPAGRRAFSRAARSFCRRGFGRRRARGFAGRSCRFSPTPASWLTPPRVHRTPLWRRIRPSTVRWTRRSWPARPWIVRPTPRSTRTPSARRIRRAGASPEPVAEPGVIVLSEAAVRARSSRGRTRRKCRAAVGTGCMPSPAASEVTRSLVASSEFSMLSVAFWRCSRASRSSARPMPAFSLSSPSCSVTIPISANATRPIHVRPPNTRRRDRRSTAEIRAGARPPCSLERLRAGRSSTLRRVGPETRRGLGGTVSGRAGAAVRRGRTAGAATPAGGLMPDPRSR